MSCLELPAAKQKAQRAACETRCAEQLKASKVVSERADKVAATCVPLTDCNEFADCSKRVPITMKGDDLEALRLPIPDELKARWIELECALVKKYGARLAQVAQQAKEPDVREVQRLASMMRAADPDVMSTLTSEAAKRCSP